MPSNVYHRRHNCVCSKAAEGRFDITEAKDICRNNSEDNKNRICTTWDCVLESLGRYRDEAQEKIHTYKPEGEMLACMIDTVEDFEFRIAQTKAQKNAQLDYERDTSLGHMDWLDNLPPS